MLLLYYCESHLEVEYRDDELGVQLSFPRTIGLLDQQLWKVHDHGGQV